MPVFYGLGATEKREILVCVLHILRYLDDASLVKAWQQNMARTRLFFKLLEECQELLEVRFSLPYSRVLLLQAARSAWRIYVSCILQVASQCFSVYSRLQWR